MTKPDEPLLSRLQRWVEPRADGEWEHSGGVTIETLNNPGWSFVVDVNGTDLERATFHPVTRERSERDWFTCRVEGGVFLGAGGPTNLTDLIGESSPGRTGRHGADPEVRRTRGRAGDPPTMQKGRAR